MFDSIKELFKSKEGAPLRAPEVASPSKSGEQAWSEGSMYQNSSIPKYNPDSLIGRKGFGVYGKMMTDEQVKAVVRFKRDAVTSRSFSFKCEHEELSDEENEMRVQLFDHIVCQMEGSTTDAFNGIMSALYNGYSMTEKIHKPVEWRRKAWVGLERLELKPCDTFYFHVDDYGVIKKITQKMGMKEQEIDADKFIHYVQNPDYDKHYGRSELREAYRAWFSKDMAIRFQNIHMERFACGFAWVQPKEGKTIVPGSAEYATLQNVLRNLSASSSFILPGGLEFNVEHPATTDMFERAIAQHDKSIAKALLVPNLLGITEQGNTGSFAQSKTQLEAFFWTLDADIKRLEEALNEHVFRELGDYNFGDNYYPTFSFNDISEERKMEIIKTWTSLVTGKAVQASDTDEEYLRKQLGMPEKGEPLVAPVDPNAPPPPGAAPEVDEETGLPVDPKTGKPMDPKQVEETIVGKAGITVSAFRKLFGHNPDQPRDEAGRFGEGGGVVADASVKSTRLAPPSAFSRAMKRVDFAVIANKADNSTKDAAYEIAVINSAAVARVVALATELKLGTAEGDPRDVQKINYTASEMSALKNAVHGGLKDAWSIGESHARKEISKAKGATFAVNDLALQDVAAAYLKQKAYTLAGDINAATQKTIRNILMEGIKVSKTPEETKRAIYKALESDGMLTEEAVMEALGATTVKSANARIETAIRTTSFEAINEARYQFFSEPELQGFVEALEYSAILDDRTTEICSQLDGSTYGIDSEVWSTFRPPNHFNCRSLLIPVTSRDTWEASEQPGVMPQKGFGFNRCNHNHKGEGDEI